MSQGAGACPKCGSTNTKVNKTSHESKKTKRWHLCKGCGHRWVTVQKLASFVGWA